MSKSIAQQVAEMSPEEQAEILSAVNHEDLIYDWSFWGRPEQFIRGNHFITALIAGRAFGKSRALSEWVREVATKYPGCRIALVGRTTADVIGTMINGESGIIAVHPPEERPEHQVSKRRLVWPNGSIAETFSSQEPSQLRGPQFHFAACDETGTWLHIPDDSGLTAWDNVKFATRLKFFDGKESVEPQIVVATTPKKTETIIDLFEEAVKKPHRVKIVTGSTFDNAGNLSAVQLEELTDLYGGTQVGRQELYGELLGDIEGVMWTADLIEGPRIKDFRYDPYSFPIRIVAVDPSMSEEPRDECGIVVIGATSERNLHKRKAFVIEDVSGRMAPAVWAQRVVDMAKKYNAVVVVEKNQGGDMLPLTIHSIDPDVKVFTVWARGSKSERAQPVVMRYQQGRVHHLGYFEKLENQMTTWDPEHSKKSPDRVDALTWGIHAAIIKPPAGLGQGGVTVRAARGRLPGYGQKTRGVKGMGRTMVTQENVDPPWYRDLTSRM